MPCKEHRLGIIVTVLILLRKSSKEQWLISISGPSKKLMTRPYSLLQVRYEMTAQYLTINKCRLHVGK